ncbi:uncharacterized protein V6R79_015166 [Siganus canaliculatus]
MAAAAASRLLIGSDVIRLLVLHSLSTAALEEEEEEEEEELHFLSGRVSGEAARRRAVRRPRPLESTVERGDGSPPSAMLAI